MINPVAFQGPASFSPMGGMPGLGLSPMGGAPGAEFSGGPAGLFQPTNELGQGGDASGINQLLQSMMESMGGQQQQDPVQMLQQQIQQTQMQLQQAQAQGDEPMVQQLSQKLQELQAQLQALTGGGDQAAAGGGDAGGAAPMGGAAPAGDGGGGGAPAGGGGAPAGGAGGAPSGGGDLQGALNSLLGDNGTLNQSQGADSSPLNQAGGANTPLAGGGSNQFDSLIQEAAQKYGVDPNLVKSVIKQESGFNPNAKSGVGSWGLMQLMPGTARELGVKNAFDPRQNIMGGTKYLSQQLKTFGGDVKKALAAYNAGAGNVKKYGGVPPFKETQNYVKNITADYSNRTAQSRSTTQVASSGGTKTGGGTTKSGSTKTA